MDRLQFDYSKLKGRITEKCGSQRAFAKLMKMSEATLTAKLACRVQFNQGEIARSIPILEIEPGTVSDFYFTQKV